MNENTDAQITLLMENIQGLIEVTKNQKRIASLLEERIISLEKQVRWLQTK